MASKQTSDGKEVPARVFYYLLDFKDTKEGFDILFKTFNKEKVIALTYEEFWMYFDIATKQEKEWMEK